ncbi:hypothetical protein [Methylorubrum populi]|uniref:hypothetical protein n=1 Tax=Methylorubrum populi TaxID=223967 RepID=UPI000DB3F4E0|nr:hypothetical protein [Methylorubrum populi]PZP71756.1 MAG: hypothetical protein DI590_05705 [Methylorubrum populi]
MANPEKGRFYLTGLGLLMRDVRFTPEENETLNVLCRAAAQSDATFWDLTRKAQPGSDLWRGIEQLKNTFRRLGKHQILQAHYDRAAQFHGSVSAD